MINLYNVAGHNIRAKGALAYNGIYEHDYTTDLQKRITRLAPSSWNVAEDSENMSIRDVLNLVDKSGFGIDIHFNNNNPAATGTEVFVHRSTSLINRLIAGKIVRGISDTLHIPIRRYESHRDYKYSNESNPGKLLIIDGSKIPFILIEVCFLNKNDLSKYNGKEDSVAQIIIDAYKYALIYNLDPKSEKRV